ncbi:MAG: ATP-dependent DNA helicase RecG [Patescibacteria group bacterium]
MRKSGKPTNKLKKTVIIYIMKLSDSLGVLKGIGPESAKKLASAKLESIEDLLSYWPRKYEDYSTVLAIKDVKPGNVTVRAKIETVVGRYSRRGLHITEATATDKTGSLHLTWFNQPYRARGLRADVDYYISGTFDLSGQSLSIVNPSIQLATDLVAGGRILAVYPETKVVKSTLIRKAISSALPATKLIPEVLPAWLVKDAKLMSHGEAIEKLHAPATLADLETAQKRLSFEELFELQLGSQLTKAELAHEKATPISFHEELAVEFTKHLGFKLTDDQRKTIWQIYKDLGHDTPMNRLIEGDVGSGKTVVAAMAAVMVMNAGHQVMYMAPTEILARQQAETLSQLFAHTKWKDQIGLLVGSLKAAQKTALHKRIADGSCRLVVGTHALIQDAVATDNVALVVIDEQHRFGVDQRQKLRSKAGFFPHVLCMTATPIPRSLALTLYGELDLSIIKDKPPGRKVTETQVVSFSARSALYQDVDIEISRGRQVFVVCPLINESDVLQVKAAETLYKELSDKLLSNRKIGLVHGSMKTADKEKVMKDFAVGSLDLLVATTVIEVGVNIQNATVMIIEGAERFGLAQIHQLRGRVGRAEHQSYCYLVPSQDIGMTKRLRAVESTNDGFRLAELDLELRGPGAIYGSRQSGELDLRMASLNDREQVGLAKHYAEMFIKKGENLLKYPQLNRRVAHFRSLQKLN